MAATPAWPWLRIGAGSLSLQVRARPGAARRGIAGALAVPRSAIALERGHRGRLKLIRIATADPGALAAKIELLARGPAIGENGKR